MFKQKKIGRLTVQWSKNTYAKRIGAMLTYSKGRRTLWLCFYLGDVNFSWSTKSKEDV